MSGLLGTVLSTGTLPPRAVQGFWFIPRWGEPSEADARAHAPSLAPGIAGGAFWSAELRYQVSILMDLGQATRSHGDLQGTVEFSAGISQYGIYSIDDQGKLHAPYNYKIHAFTSVIHTPPHGEATVLSDQLYNDLLIYIGDVVAVIMEPNTYDFRSWFVRFHNYTRFKSQTHVTLEIGPYRDITETKVRWSMLQQSGVLPDFVRTFCDKAWYTTNVGLKHVDAKKGKPLHFVSDGTVLATCSRIANGVLMFEYVAKVPAASTVTPTF